MRGDIGHTFKEGLVSVVIPTYNDDEYLPRAVKSALNQSYELIELIIIDSSDSTIARHLENTNEQVTLITAPPRGPANARNIGIEAADGEYIAFLDADDEWLEDKLVRQISRLVDTRSAFTFSEEYHVTPDSGKKLLSGIDFTDSVPPHEQYFRRGTGIGSRTVVIHRKCVSEYRFDEELEAREDPHLWTRILSRYNPVKVNEPLAIKYSRSNSLTSNLDIVWKNERKSIIKLANEFSELEKYRDERLQMADYRYAKRLLEQNEYIKARSILAALLRDYGFNVKVFSLLVISYLPFGNTTTLSSLNYLYRELN